MSSITVHCLYRRRLRAVILICVLSILTYTTVGCYSVRSKADIIGLYEMSSGKDKIDLNISPDGNYSETISWATGKLDKRAGKWCWNRGSISFDSLWIPKSFAPE